MTFNVTTYETDAEKRLAATLTMLELYADQPITVRLLDGDTVDGVFRFATFNSHLHPITFVIDMHRGGRARLMCSAVRSYRCDPKP